MKRTTLVAAVAIIAIITVASVYGGYSLMISSPASSSPTPAPQPVVVTIDDATGAQINVTLPVKRIICLTSVEMVCAFGAADKVVGRTGMDTSDILSILPASILNVTSVGDSDMAPNMELIVELKPDLVLASERLTDANRKTLEDAGAAVIEDTLTGSRRNQYITNLGLILDAEEIADEFISYETYYKNLVATRTANISRSEKPLVFYEWYQPWFSAGPDSSDQLMIEAAGGINIAENASSSYPQLSAEFVSEANPDVIIRMLTYLDGTDYAAFVQLRNDIMTRPGLSGVTAVADGAVYVIKDTLLVGRDIIGLLYYAKWFHPAVFADIDPAAVHEQMIQKFWGVQLEGVYLVP